MTLIPAEKGSAARTLSLSIFNILYWAEVPDGEPRSEEWLDACRAEISRNIDTALRAFDGDETSRAKLRKLKSKAFSLVGLMCSVQSLATLPVNEWPVQAQRQQFDDVATLAREFETIADDYDRARMTDSAAKVLSEPERPATYPAEDPGTMVGERSTADSKQWVREFVQVCGEIVRRLEESQSDYVFPGWWTDIIDLTHELQAAKNHLAGGVFSKNEPAVLLFEYNSHTKQNGLPEILRPFFGPQYSSLVDRGVKGSCVSFRVCDPFQSRGVAGQVVQHRPGNYEHENPDAKSILLKAARQWSRAASQHLDGMDVIDGTDPGNETQAAVLNLARKLSGSNLQVPDEDVRTWLQWWWREQKFESQLPFADAPQRIVAGIIRGTLKGHRVEIQFVRKEDENGELRKVPLVGQINPTAHEGRRTMNNQERAGLDEYLSFRLNGGPLPSQSSKAGEWQRTIEMFAVSNAPIDSDEYRASILVRIPAHVIDQLAERAGLSISEARRLPTTSLIELAAKQESGRKGSPVPAAGTGKDGGEPADVVDSGYSGFHRRGDWWDKFPESDSWCRGNRSQWEAEGVLIAENRNPKCKIAFKRDWLKARGIQEPE